LNRLLGDNDEAHKSLLAALRRQAPWLSSGLLEVKLQFAASEASANGKAVSVGVPSDQAQAALALRESGASAANQASGPNVDVLRLMPLLHVLALGSDQALGWNYDTALLEDLRAALGSSLPVLKAD
jgi:hypothetical protein